MSNHKCSKYKYNENDDDDYDYYVCFFCSICNNFITDMCAGCYDDAEEDGNANICRLCIWRIKREIKIELDKIKTDHYNTFGNISNIVTDYIFGESSSTC